jgi:hypothetical protein
MKKQLMKGKTILGHKCTLNLSTNYFPQIVKKFKRPNSSNFCFCCTCYFVKGSFATNKLDLQLEEIFGLFLEGWFSSFLKGLFMFFQIFKRKLQ